MNNENMLKNELEKLNYEVDVIPRGNTLSADYAITLGSTKSIIEVKTMNDNESVADEYFTKVESGVVFEHVNTKDTRKNVSQAVGQISSSYKQLDANGYKIICIYSNTIDSNIDVRRRLFDFYGICEFFGIKFDINSLHSDLDFKQCYGFYNSIFLEYQSLDGALILSKNEKLFLPNFYSEKYDSILGSSFLKPILLSPEWQVYDPLKLEKNGGALILDEQSLTVKNHNIVEMSDLIEHERSKEVIDAKRYLQNKYQYTILRMEQNRGRAFVVGTVAS